MSERIHLLSLHKGLLALSLLLAMVLSGCADIGKGVAEAVLEKAEEVDTRVGQVRGQPFEGVSTGLAKPRTKTRLLMVHGVGDHLPGYATEFSEKLAKELDISAKVSNYKNIKLFSSLAPDKDLGNLRITRFQNENTSKELWFYELTWSEITRDQKALLGFDNSGEYSFRRTEINNMLKKFSNDTGPDPIIYLGESRVHILRAFSQAACWMGKEDWSQLPNDQRAVCMADETFALTSKDDELIFVSHSLGSRITIDGLQQIASMLVHPEKYSNKNYEVAPSGLKETHHVLQQKKVQLFMLSNQLPMLQLGRELPEVSGKPEDYCTAGGKYYNQRLFNETSIIAFSDPNDLLSYAIPHDFAEKYLDSRLCAKITNVNINIAKILDAFGLAKVANPLTAHTGYDTDDRVIAMIAKGIGSKHTAPLVKQKCEWTQITD